jgi:hypothetical protein
MSAQAFAHRCFGLAGCTAFSVCLLAQPARADGPPHPAAAASAASASSTSGARKGINATPLRFDPPAAGIHRPTRAEYEDCIEHPSLDGLHTDCSALLPDTPPKPALSAKPGKAR